MAKPYPVCSHMVNNVFDWFCLDGNKSKPAEALNKKALEIITRVSEKLNGNDFTHEKNLTVPNQVNLLIQLATSHENLCQSYIGWYV